LKYSSIKASAFLGVYLNIYVQHFKGSQRMYRDSNTETPEIRFSPQKLLTRLLLCANLWALLVFFNKIYAALL
jgi:hypothetical protein